jgi:hypothetical protein
MLAWVLRVQAVRVLLVILTSSVLGLVAGCGGGSNTAATATGATEVETQT